jgi:tetratricopeptide (TPR) repeat protein
VSKDGAEPAQAGVAQRPGLEDALARISRLLDESPREALAELRSILAAQPGDPGALTLLGTALRRLGEERWQEKVQLLAKGAELHDPALREAARLLAENDPAGAERIVRQALQKNPRDVAALRILAQIGERLERFEDSEKLLIRALKIAPHFAAAGFDLANIFYRQNKFQEAIEELDHLLEEHPGTVEYEMLKAAALSRLGRTDEALALHERVLARRGDDPQIWTLYGHALRTRGRQPDSVAAYRRALEIAPHMGLAWFSLANLKTVKLQDGDIAAMVAALAGDDLSEDDRIHLHFALGKAAEDGGSAREAFSHYAEGNRLVRARKPYDPEKLSDYVRRSERLFAPSFFAERAEHGSDAPDPIFILGMPRAGSTLVEQILASHPSVEGTAELPYIPEIARSLQVPALPYPERLAELAAEDILRFAGTYLDRSRRHRQTSRPLFIDKNPTNWLDVGLIQLILPRATIIDVRRHPLDCGWSNFKQHYAEGYGFAYSLEYFGRYYRDYVRLLGHFDRVRPGSIHRVVYERLVADPEGEIRRLLDDIGLPFDEACLRFHENQRVVRTFSSEQVRRPINREGVDQWRAYEEWLGALKEGLGTVLASYPDAPAEYLSAERS